MIVNVKGVINLPARVEETLFRIAQEALNNVRKHAGVLQAELYLTVTSTDVLLVVKDEGCGFHMKELERLAIDWFTKHAGPGACSWWNCGLGNGME